MKKLFLFAAAATMFAACSKDTTEDIAVLPDGILRVSFSDDNSRVQLDENSRTVWNEGDLISIFNKTTGNECWRFDGKTGNTVGTISRVSGSAGGSAIGKIFAVYPYAEYNAVSANGTVTTEIPATQKYCTDSYGVGNNIMVASSERGDLSFKNVLGWIKIRLSGTEPVKSLVLKGNNGETLAGAATVNANLAVSLAADAAKSLTLDCGEGVALSSDPTAFYFAVVPQVFEKGITITAHYSDGSTFKKSTDKPIAVGRNHIVPMAEIDNTYKKEREALIAIYNALDGDNWVNNTNWCSYKPLNEWYGVVTNNSNNFVIGLELYFNGAAGDIPSDLGVLKNLETLRIGDNNISSIPKEIGELTNLTWLDLGGHKITTIPEEIDKLVNLRYLGLWGENITELQPSFYNLKNLEQISFYLSKTDEIPQGIFTLDKLISISYQAKFSQFPTSLREMTQLEFLSFTYSDMSGINIPQWLSELSNLNYLSLYGCGLTGEIPESLGYLTNLEDLEIGFNNLTGTIPASFSQLTRLRNLNIKYANLYGSIPEAIINMPWFQYRWGEILLGNQFDMSGIELKGPEFTVTDIKGNEIISKEIYKSNKYTIFYQWRPAENIDTTQLLISLYEKFHNRGLEIIADTGDSLAEIITANTPWINFIRGEGNHIYINDEPYYTIDSYPMQYWGIPCITVIDSDGKVVYSNLIDSYRIDIFLAKNFDNADKDLYESTDYSQDGMVNTLQTATIGNGIDIILMGDAYSDRQIADGTYKTDMTNLYNNLFTEEPYKSFKNMFNVYYVNAVSINEGYGIYNETAFSGYFGNGTLVGGNDGRVFTYARKAINDQRMDNALIIVAMNSNLYAGTCYMYYPVSNTDYGNGISVAYFPKGSDEITFAQLLHHEACGHGFAKLADEYAYEYMGAVPTDYVSQVRNWQSDWGWYKNVDFTSDPAAVKWHTFLSDPRYANEGLGVFEGGATYWTGVWRPTENSIMRYNTGGFNAPSREAIYYRIHKLAYGESWNYDYEDFVAYDAVNRKASAGISFSTPIVPKDFVPLAPPVVVGKSWRDAR